MTDEQFEQQYAELKDQLTSCYAMILEIRQIVTDQNAMIHNADKLLTDASEQVTPLIEDIRTGGVMKLLSGGLKRK